MQKKEKKLKEEKRILTPEQINDGLNLKEEIIMVNLSFRVVTLAGVGP